MNSFKPLALRLAALLAALCAGPVHAEAPQKAPEIATALCGKTGLDGADNSWWRPPIRWRPMPATAC